MARSRSFWGWGYEDKLPGDNARRALASRLAALTGTPPELAPLPSLDAVTMPEPRYTVPVELRSIGTTDKRERAIHTYGRGYRDLVRGFRGDYASAPDWIFHPTEEEHLLSLFRFCERESIALVPYGGGTSVVSGVEFAASGRFRGVACVDLSRMDKVLSVDEISRSAHIQAGATGSKIAEQLETYGLTLRHYPQSFELSTLGGWIATRAAGHYATLYTHIDDFVESVRMVTPAGVFETRRLPGSGAGPSPDRLVLGSEGAFGIITEAWLRVQPRPRWRASASVSFDRFEDAVDVVRILAQSGLNPVNCRLLDAGEAMLHQVDSEGNAVLLLAFESADHPIETSMERALSIATDLGGRCKEEPKYTTDVIHSIAPRPLHASMTSSRPPPPSSGSVRPPAHDVQEASVWKQAFFDAPYLQSALVLLGMVCDTFETACTWDRFPALHASVVAAANAAMQKVGGGGLLTCRFTHVYPDGPAPYYTFLTKGRPGEELEQWAAIKAAVSEAIVSTGGTITHHHAVGRVHRPWWEKERPALFEKVLVSAKNELDPAGILNPGCLLPIK
ncbi:Alkyldihydroxyacetonephosphate synthase [Labilithrix luteola]|uniref:Alkyldihydroxyacetonephosphate synthase n=1 Tax=Labilithrix luteola TaxID=1391654 RepID=A0A0K1QEZ5_9BACT|nr:FAD-binding oxidoreductase [Labilithrix luteola]AKV04217.1 Alkyldihydroxyacetonephosphate synthase [Labilithrix luteola]